jgi:hypothetical protein
VTRRIGFALVAVVAVAGAAVAALALRGQDDTSKAHESRPAAVVPGAVLAAAAGRWSGPVDGTAGDLAWRVASTDVRVAVRDGDGWRTVLRANDAGDRFAVVRARAVDLTGDGVAEVVFGFRDRGSASILEIDVVQAPGDVVFHQEADKGVAVTRRGELDLYAAQFGPDDPNCCPSSYRRSVVRFTGGAWRAASDRVAPDAVPPGQL